jgi:Putative metallopeptidase
MLNYLKWLSGLALVSLFTVGDLPGVFPKAVTHAQTPATALANQQSTTIARNRDGGRIKVVYEETDDFFSRSLIQAYQKYGYFEKVSALITSEIALPRDITVILTNCGMANAFYSSKKHAIVICNELTQENYQLLVQNGYEQDEALKTAIFASIFFFYHEAGHMLIHELNLPVVGKEEDVADQFSAFFLLMNDSSAGKSDSGEILMSAAKLFALEKSLPSEQGLQDEHALNRQRFYNLVCILYGAAPNKYQDLVARLDYSEQRLDRCQAESESLVTAWQRLLEPYLKT